MGLEPLQKVLVNKGLPQFTRGLVLGLGKLRPGFVCQGPDALGVAPGGLCVTLLTARQLHHVCHKVRGLAEAVIQPLLKR